jgi:hypothetical protein
VGGLVGVCRGTIRNSHAKGNVAALSSGGGFCGRNFDINSGGNLIIEDSYATGSVVSENSDHVGGFIGHLYRRAQFTRTYALGDATAKNSVGGFVGSIDMGPIVIQESYALGNSKGNARVGGFLGYAYRYDATIEIKNSYARGSVTANSQGGGFAGLGAANISSSYAIGRVQMDTTERDLGGFMGLMHNGGTNTLSNCFWDINTSGRSSSAGGQGRTSVQMKSLDTFIDFDSSLWNLEAGRYPTLSWE